MPRALIQINSTTGSNPPNGTALVIDTLVQLNNSGNGGELTYLWEWLYRPEGSSAAFSNPTLQNPTFTPDVEGTYLIRLTVNQAEATESVNTVIAAIKQLKSKVRIPAAGEITEESTTQGWARDMNRLLNTLDAAYADGCVVTGHAQIGLSTGTVVWASAVETLKPGLPGEEVVLSFEKALGSDADHMDQPLYVMLAKVGGGTSCLANELFRAKKSGLIGPLSLGAGSAGDALYVSDLGALSVTPGTYTRRVGTIALVDAGDYYVLVDGSLGHHEGALRLFGANSKVRQQSGDLTIQTEAAGADIILLAGATSIGWTVDGATGKLTASSGSQLISGVANPAAGTDAVPRDWVYQNGGVPILYFGNEDTPGSTTSVVLDPGHGARTAVALAGASPGIRAPRAGKLSKLYVRAHTGPAGAGLDITVYVNGGATAITCNLGATATNAEDLTHAVTVVAGDLIQVTCKGDNAGISAGATEINCSLLFSTS